MAYTWGKGINSSALTKKQINKKINEMKKRGYKVPQNIREQLSFSKRDTLAKLEKRIAEKSEFEFTNFSKVGSKVRTIKGITSGAEAYKLEKAAKEYNKRVQRLQNLKQYKGKDFQWTKIDIRKKSLNDEDEILRLKERLKKSPKEIIKFEQRKKQLPWDNLMKSLDSTTGVTQEAVDMIKKSMTELGYKEDAMRFDGKDTTNRFGLLVGQKVDTKEGIRLRVSKAIYSSGDDANSFTGAITDLLKKIYDNSGMSKVDFLKKFGPKDQDSMKKMLDEINKTQTVFTLTTDDWEAIFK